MRKLLHDKKGLTFTELMVAAAVFVIVVAVALSAWIFAYRTWTADGRRTQLRVDLLKALETINNDTRLSSATYMAFYPEPAVSGVYTAVSMPVAEIDGDGLCALNANGEIEWDKTVIYHVYTEAGGSETLRRTVFDPRDNTMDYDQRYAQLEDVVTTGSGGSGATTDTDFLENLDTFRIEPLPAVIEFYQDFSTPVRVGEVIFGWAQLDAGDHTIRFEVTGKNDSSAGHDFGIDYLKIEPGGEPREVEYYNSSFAPSGAIGSSGGTITRVYGTEWGNDNYLEYSSSAEGDYIEFTDYYDLWRESSFEDASRNNTMLYGEEVRLKLELPEDRQTGEEETTWFAYTDSGDSTQEGRDGDLPAYPAAVRTIVSNDYIDMEADLIRVKLKSSSENPLKIAAAYVTRRDMSSTDEDGLPNQGTSGLDIDQYHLHQQLFFQDIYDMDSDGDTEDIVEYAFIAPGSEIWSEWTAYPFVLQDAGGDDLDYFATFCVPDLESVSFPSGWSAFDPTLSDCKYWQGSQTHSYYITDGTYSDILHASGTPVWSGSYTVNTSNNIYITAEIDTWDKTGTAESKIVDTGKDDPSYNQIKWSEDNPEKTEILLKARSSDSQYMTGAADWASITGSTADPEALSIGTGRYVQFLAELSTDPFWEAPGQNLSYADYVDAQVGLGNPYEFPTSSGEYLVTGVYSTWLDDVEIDWPGDSRMCVISGYIARKNDYGQVKVSVDGRDLVKTLDVDVSISVDFQETTITEESSVEVEPRNTGK